MTSAEVRRIVEAEIGEDWSRTNLHKTDLRRCLIEPRKHRCRNTFPKMDEGRPLDLWIVLEEFPREKRGYLIVFDDQTQRFGLADWEESGPVFLGFHGTFINTLEGM